jgi:hypothetical protein
MTDPAEHDDPDDPEDAFYETEAVAPPSPALTPYARPERSGHRTASRFPIHLVAIVVSAAMLTAAGLACLADHPGALGHMLSASKMLPVVVFTALFNVMFVTPVILHLSSGRSGKTGRRSRRRALRTAVMAALWQTGLVAPFVVIALRLIPVPTGDALYAAALVPIHAFGAVMAVMVLGRLYTIAAVLVCGIGPLTAFLISEVGGRFQPWLVIISPFGQVTAFLHLMNVEQITVMAVVVIYTLCYVCIVLLPSGASADD